MAATSTWTELSGTFIAPTCDVLDFRLYLEGPAGGVDIDVDAFSVIRQ